MRRALVHLAALCSGVACGRTALDSNPVNWLVPALEDAGSGDTLSTNRADTRSVGTTTLSFARSRHTATLLGNGQVLLAGGRRQPDAAAASMVSTVATAELYDPLDARFRTTGAMQVPRLRHTATLLQDGRVLIAGGLGDSGVLAQAELFDPPNGRFTPTGSMTSPRLGHQATLLADGRVLITGGRASANYFDSISQAELYDPTTSQFEATVLMYQARSEHTATAVPSGEVVILGGREDAWAIEVYDGSFSAPIYDARGTLAAYGVSAHTATLLHDGTVLIAGGWRNLGRYDYVAWAGVYDEGKRSRSEVGAMVVPRAEHSATLLGDGRVLLAGGWGTSADALATFEIYDPNGRSFRTEPMSTARVGHTATLLPNGKVLLAGGQNTDVLATSELY